MRPAFLSDHRKACDHDHNMFCPLFLTMDQSPCDMILSELTAVRNLIPILPWSKMNKSYSNLIQEKHIAHVLCVCHFRKFYGGPLSRDFIFLLNTSFTLKLKIRGCIILAWRLSYQRASSKHVESIRECRKCFAGGVGRKKPLNNLLNIYTTASFHCKAKFYTVKNRMSHGTTISGSTVD